MAQEKDIYRIYELLGQVNYIHHIIRPDIFNIGCKYTIEQLKELIIDDSGKIFVAVDDNDYLAGYCFTKFSIIYDDNIRTDIKTLYIDDLCVDKEIRGKHVGQELYQYVVKYAKDNRFYNVTLHVWSGNDNAENFYEAMGLKPQYVCLEEIIK